MIIRKGKQLNNLEPCMRLQILGTPNFSEVMFMRFLRRKKKNNLGDRAF